MSDSDSEEIDFLSTEDQQESEEICSPAFGRVNPPEEPPQRQRVVPTSETPNLLLSNDIFRSYIP